MSLDRYARFRRGRQPASFADMVPAEFRPKPESDDDPVTRIIVYIEREHSGGMEYDCVDPSNVELSPGLAMIGPHRAGAQVSLSFTAGPRVQDMRIWTRHNTSRAMVLSALSDLADTFGHRIQPKPGPRSGPESRKKAAAEPAAPKAERPAPPEDDEKGLAPLGYLRQLISEHDAVLAPPPPVLDLADHHLVAVAFVLDRPDPRAGVSMEPTAR